MKTKIVLLLGMAFCLAPAMLAQDHGEVGVYGEYFRFQALHANMLGVGGRVSFNFIRKAQLEAEMGYLFKRGFAENFSNGIPNNVSVVNSNIRVLHGMFGPKLNFSSKAFHPFVTVKGGFFNSEINGQSPGPGFTSQINNLRAGNVNGVLYPGGGVEGYIGFLGLRLDAGDEIIFNRRHANHNFRMSFGPHIRF